MPRLHPLARSSSTRSNEAGQRIALASTRPRSRRPVGAAELGLSERMPGRERPYLAARKKPRSQSTLRIARLGSPCVTRVPPTVPSDRTYRSRWVLA
jgi:hypothetical protein